MRRPKRFTLIELLVVVAIIAILAAMLLPALNRSRKQARRAVCVNTLSNWGKALMIYSEDFNRRLPGRYPTFMYSNTVSSVFRTVMPSYGIEQSMAFCADSGLDERWYDAFWNFDANNTFMTYSYFPNASNAGANPRSMSWLGQYETDQYGREMLLMADTSRLLPPFDPVTTNHHNPGMPAFSFASGTIPGLVYNNRIPLGITTLVADGRVEWRNWGELNFGIYYTIGTDYNYHWR